MSNTSSPFMRKNPSVTTILILAANPSSTSRLRLDKEVREIDEGLRRAGKQDLFRLEQKWAVQQRDFYRAILDCQPQIVHFIGHGAGNEGIVLEDESGQAAPVSANALSSMFELFASVVECVVLNACYSEVQARAISQHVKYVIGVNQTVGDKAALTFAVAFYDAIAVGEEVEFAYKLGCAQLVGLSEEQPILITNRKSQPPVSPKTPSENSPLEKDETLQEVLKKSLSIGSLRGAGNDLVGDRDQLGFNCYVKAFADLIESPYTKPPLTIGIFGSWGMGKSFLLDHITRELEQRSQEYELAKLLTAVVNSKYWFGNLKLTELVTHIVRSDNLGMLRDSALLSIVMLEKLQAVTIQNLKVSDFLEKEQKLRVKERVWFLPWLVKRNEEITLSTTSHLLLSSYLLKRKNIENLDEQNHLLISNKYNLFSQTISFFYFKYILTRYFRKVAKLERENQWKKSSSAEQTHQFYPHVYIVRFNAWEYSAAKAIWSGLVRKIMNELEKKLFQGFIGQLDLIRFKFWRNLQLQLEDNKGTLIVIWVILAGLLAFALWKYKIDSKLFWGALVALGATGLFKLLVDTLTKPLSQWFVNLIQGSNYGKHIDYMEEIHSDLGLLAKRLEKDNSRILVIIDDLDRCEPQKAVEVLQAVHLLLNFKSFIVCLGIDARIITRAVEQYYKNLLGPAKASGYEYLDKIVQIPFRIPESTPTEVKSFICDLLGNPLPPISTVSLPSDSSSTEESVKNQPTKPDNTTPSISTSSNQQDKPATDKLPEPPALVAFSYEELEIFYQYVKFLRPNPRHLKRLVNVYRLVRTLAEYKEETFILNNPDPTIRWLVICGQWPYTAYAMLYYFNEMLERLEEEKGNVNPLEYLETNFQISSLKYLHQRVLLQFESNQDAKNKQKKLDHDLDLLRMLLNKGYQLTWTELNILSRYTVNFNPAVESVIKAEVPVEVSAYELEPDF